MRAVGNVSTRFRRHLLLTFFLLAGLLWVCVMPADAQAQAVAQAEEAARTGLPVPDVQPPPPPTRPPARSGRSTSHGADAEAQRLDERFPEDGRLPGARLRTPHDAWLSGGLVPVWIGETAPLRAPLAVAASPVITFNMTFGAVTGFVAANQDVHLVLQRGGATIGEARARTDAVGYFAADLMWNGRWAAVQAGDSLDVIAGAATTTLVAPALTGLVNPATDSLAGSLTGAPLPAALTVSCWGNALTVATDAAGAYAANLGGLIDLTWFQPVDAAYRDANGNWIVATFTPLNGMAVSPTYGEVSGATAPGATVQVTLTQGAAQHTRAAVANPRSGWWYVTFASIRPGDIVEARVGGATLTSMVPELAGNLNLPADSIVGSGPPNSAVSAFVHRHSGFNTGYVWQGAPTDGAGLFTAAFPAGTLDSQQWAVIAHHTTAQADTWIEEDPRMATVSWADNGVWGYTDPDAEVTATLRRGGGALESAQTVARSGYGYFQVLFDTEFQIGDQVTVAGGGLNTAVDLLHLTAQLDLPSNTLSGQAPASARLFASSSTFNGYGPNWTDYLTAGGDGAYQMSWTGQIDVHNGRYAWVSFPQDSDVDQQAWQQAFAPTPYLNLNETHDGVWGYVPAPNAAVTLTLMTAGGVFKGQVLGQTDNYGDFGWQQFRNGGGVININPGDRVRVEIAGWSQEVAAGAIAVTVDSVQDRVSGVGPANSFVELRVRWGNQRLRFPTAADGAFMADFAGIADILAGTEVEVITYDANWNRQQTVGAAPHARANTNWNNVDGWFGPGVSVQYTVTTAGGSPKGGGAGTANPDGWLNGVGCGCDLQPGDRVHVTSSRGFAALLVPITITGRIDVNADRVAGVMAGGDFPGSATIWVWSDARQQGTGRDIGIAADGSFTADFTDFDIQSGDTAEVWYYDANHNEVGTEFNTVYFDVNYGHDWVSSNTEPEAAVTITVTGKATLHGQADSSGYFGSWNGVWQPAHPNIEPGDTVLVETGGEVRRVDPVGTIAGAVDLAADTFAGTIQAPGITGDLRVRCEVWTDNGPPRIMTWANAAGGAFTCDYGAVGWDLAKGQEVAVRYYEPDGDRVINVFQSPYARANVAWNAVDGWFGPGVNVQYTVTSAGGSPKGGGAGTARSDGWLNGIGCDCDLAPGDRVHVTSSAGFDAQLTPILITGRFDAANDRVTGVVQGGVFPAKGRMEIGSETRTDWRSSDFDIAANGAFTVDFGGVFDIRAGDKSEAWYIDPAGNWLGTNLYTLHIEVAYDGDFVYAQTEPGATITISVAGKAALTGQANGEGVVEGWRDEWQALWTPAQPNIAPGDTVAAAAAGWTKQVSPVGQIAAQADPASETIAGVIQAPGFSQPLRVRCDVWEDDGPPGVDAAAFADPNGGSFACDFRQVGGNLRFGDTVAVRYYEPDSDQVIHSFRVQAQTYLPVIQRR
mgnify:CR=1 FL=1